MQFSDSVHTLPTHERVPPPRKVFNMTYRLTEHVRGFSLTTCLLLLVFGCLSGATNTAHAQARGYVTNTCNNTVSVIDTTTNTVIDSIMVGVAPFGVAVTPDGTRVYVTSLLNGGVSVIDTATNTVITTIPVGAFLGGLAITSDGERVYVLQRVGIVSVIDTATNTVVANIPVGSGAFDIAITPDDSRAYVGHGDAPLFTPSVTVIDTATNTVIGVIPVGAGPTNIAITPDGTRAYITPPVFNAVFVLDLVSNIVIASIPTMDLPPSDLAITPDGTRVYVVNQLRTLSIIDTATNTVIGAVPIGFGFTSITIAPDGTRAYVLGLAGSTIDVVDLTSNTVVDTITSFSCPANIAIAPLIPRTKDDCKNGGYRKFGAPAGPFKNQGQCISHIERQRRTRS